LSRGEAAGSRPAGLHAPRLSCERWRSIGRMCGRRLCTRPS
jgi:hypothetical protein